MHPNNLFLGVKKKSKLDKNDPQENRFILTKRLVGRSINNLLSGKPKI